MCAVRHVPTGAAIPRRPPAGDIRPWCAADERRFQDGTQPGSDDCGHHDLVHWLWRFTVLKHICVLLLPPLLPLLALLLLLSLGGCREDG